MTKPSEFEKVWHEIEMAAGVYLPWRVIKVYVTAKRTGENTWEAGPEVRTQVAAFQYKVQAEDYLDWAGLDDC